LNYQEDFIFCRAFDGVPSKNKTRFYLSYMLKCTRNKKHFPTFFVSVNMVGRSTFSRSFVLGVEQNHQNMVVGFPLGVVCRTFHGASFDKKIKIS
jgi:hypothetical protein